VKEDKPLAGGPTSHILPGLDAIFFVRMLKLPNICGCVNTIYDLYYVQFSSAVNPYNASLSNRMSPKLSDRILVRVQQQDAIGKRRNFVAFIMQRDQIIQSLGDGWTVLEIWETLHQEGKITTGYAAFCKQVKRLVPDRGAPNRSSPANAGAIPPAKPKALAADGFNFDSIPNQEELL
jgi:hypothetical protein